MQDRLSKFSRYLFYSLIIVEAIIVIVLSFREHKNISISKEPYYSLNNGWSYVDEYGRSFEITLPTVLDAGLDESVSISRIIPDDIDFLSDISILTSNQNIEVYVDHMLIYSRYNKPSDELFDIPSDHVWEYIRLPRDAEGKLLTINLSSPYEEYAGDIGEVFAGTKTALILHNIRTSGLNLILATITLIMGIGMVMIHIYFKRLFTVNRSLLYLGWFTLICSLWLIMESNLTQMLIPNEYVISALTYLSLMTFPIPIILYIILMGNYHYKNIAICMAYLFMASAFVLIFLQLFNIMDFHQSFFIVRSEMFIMLGAILVTLFLEIIRYKNRDILVFTTASVILFFFAILEFISYRYRGSNIGVFFQFGFMLFIGILTWEALHKIAEVFRLSESAKHYQFLATRDLLTNCWNRTSYANDMDRVSLEENITVFVADMNNMKQINDTYGHAAGDEAIILCSQCLLKVFGTRVYRIGGDEFASLQFDLNEAAAEKLLNDFQTECEKTNKDIVYQFRMSIGYAFLNKEMDKSIYDTVKRADKDMYDRKNYMKIH